MLFQPGPQWKFAFVFYIGPAGRCPGPSARVTDLSGGKSSAGPQQNEIPRDGPQPQFDSAARSPHAFRQDRLTAKLLPGCRRAGFFCCLGRRQRVVPAHGNEALTVNAVGVSRALAGP
jgi:hypothetical protein